MEPEPRETRPLGSLLADLSHEAQSLWRLELELAKSELTEKAREAYRGATAASFGCAVAYAGALALVAAAALGLWTFLNDRMDPETAAWLAPLLVGGVVTAVGGAMLARGLRKLRPANLAPRETVRSLKEDKEWLKEQVT
jgi:hypothetical protein